MKTTVRWDSEMSVETVKYNQNMWLMGNLWEWIGLHLANDKPEASVSSINHFITGSYIKSRVPPESWSTV